jgi:hypothetical protein
MHESNLATRKTVEELVREWNFAMHELKTGLDHIQRAYEHLKAFDTSGAGWDLQPFRSDDTGLDFERKRKRMKGAAWRYLVNRIELKKMASISRAKEIDKQLNERPETLPDITMENIFGWLETMALKGTEFLNEAVVEVYNKLRPSAWNRHKTNSAFRVGKKMILTGRVSRAYKAGHFRVAYYFEDELRALDNVFHMLDGKALSAYRKGDLSTEIDAAPEGIGETDYFRFKCFGNGNLHLEFLRPDLVERLNSIGGSGLPDPDRD